MVTDLANLGHWQQIEDPAISLWSLCAAFTLGCGWLYATTPGQGSPSPLRVFLRWLDTLSSDLAVLGQRFGAWIGVRS